jgi:hypothetical protein
MYGKNTRGSESWNDTTPESYVTLYVDEVSYTCKCRTISVSIFYDRPSIPGRGCDPPILVLDGYWGLFPRE